MKKLFTIILSLALMIPCAFAEDRTPETAEPERYTCGDYVYSLLDDGTAEIISYKGIVEDVEIPDSLDGITVTGIGKYAFFANKFIERVSIPDSVIHIGYSPFIHSERLEQITIPDSVTGIDGNPCCNCTSLTEILVSPDHPYLEVKDGVLISKPDKRLVCYPGGLEAETYTVPDGIQVIGDHAFFGCKFLEEITIPNSVTSIGQGAFSFSNLTNLLLTDNVRSIGEKAFYCCNSLIVTVPADSYAEEYCRENDIRYTTIH